MSPGCSMNGQEDDSFEKRVGWSSRVGLYGQKHHFLPAALSCGKCEPFCRQRCAIQEGWQKIASKKYLQQK